MERTIWLEERKKGIGGSDVAGILGLSKWNTPLSIYLKKKGLFPEELEPNYGEDGFDPLYWGIVNEDAIAKKFEENNGLKCHRVNQILVHPKYDFIRASIDRRIVSSRAGLECKTSSAYKAKEWNDAIPNDYMLQCQHYLSVTNYEEWNLAALIGGNTYREFIIKRDEELIKQIEEACIFFWNNHILKSIPPTPTFEDNKLLNVLYNEDYENNLEYDSLDLSSQETLVSEIQKFKSAIKELEIAQKEKEITLKDLMKENSLAQTHNYIISWKLQQRNSLDIKKLKLDKPDIYDAYVKKSENRVMRIKEKK